MELELKRDAIHCFETVADVTICQEETQEAIVPDACPDILRIVEVCGQACLTGKQAREGMATVSGMVRASVLYLPETGGCLRHMELSVPFTCQVEAPGLTSQGTILADPRLRWAEARVLNPRKILLRVDLAVEIRACQPCERTICQGVEAAEEHGIRQFQEEQTTDQIVAVQEKPFTFTDGVDLGLSEGGELLSLRGEPSCEESRLIGSKLIFKGSVELHALLRDADGTLRTARESMPFSQIIEVPGAGEDAECEVRVVLTDLNAPAIGTTVGSAEVTLELLAQAVVRSQRPVTMLQDIYSTGWMLEVQTEEHTMRQVVDQSIRPQSVREILETTTLVRNAIDGWLSLGEIRQSREGDQMILSAEVLITALYLDDGEELQSIQRTVQTDCRLDCPVQAVCQCWCTAPGELAVVPAAGGLEVRFTLEFHCLCLAERRQAAISSARLGEERAKPDGTQPSVVLRMAAPGERLWDIAKAYGTTTEEITQANELEEGCLPTGRMLLIPRVR